MDHHHGVGPLPVIHVLTDIYGRLNGQGDDTRHVDTGRATSDVRGVLLTVVSASGEIGADDDGLRGKLFLIRIFPWMCCQRSFVQVSL